MTRWKMTLFTKRAQRQEERKSEGQRQAQEQRARANTMRKARVQERASRPKNLSKERAETVAKLDTYGANVGRKAVEPRNKRIMSENLRKLETSTGS